MKNFNTEELKNFIENILIEHIYKDIPIREARHLTNHIIIRISDGMKGIIAKSRVYGNAYDIIWDDGTTQTLGRNTITNQKKYMLEKLEVTDYIIDLTDGEEGDFVWEEMKDPMLNNDGKKISKYGDFE